MFSINHSPLDDRTTAGRPRSARALAVVLCALICGLSLIAPAVAADRSAPALHQDEVVKLVRSDRGGNDHPIRVDPQEIRAALAALRMDIDRSTIISRGTQGTMRVLTDQSIRRAAPRIVSALANATPKQDVAIRLSQGARGGNLLGGNAMTAFRLFYRDGRLNLIFGVVEENLRLKNESMVTLSPKAPREVALSDGVGLLTEIGSEKKPRTLDWLPLQAGTVGLALPSRNDWLVVDTKAALEASNNAANLAAAQAAAVAQMYGGQIQGGGQAPIVVVPAEPRMSAEDAEKMMAQLRLFLDQGLISEETYQERIQQVLDRYIGPSR